MKPHKPKNRDKTGAKKKGETKGDKKPNQMFSTFRCQYLTDLTENWHRSPQNITKPYIKKCFSKIHTSDENCKQNQLLSIIVSSCDRQKSYTRNIDIALNSGIADD
jgi:hypothetical protein